ncbi:MAG: prepilin-type N-terminal cleavage/methylation domain-containing protein [Rhodocyclaceae bacterium]|nr:MAG: prepilin-type N-terminal cleavage/methylation domain-containing protein [Rhodocyclaceae bacterium]
MSRHKTAPSPAGFTLIELVLVIVLLGILSAVIAPNLTRSGIDGRNFFDRTLNSVRFAQKLAIAQRRSVYVCIGANSVAVAFASGCASPATDPGGGAINFSNTAVSMSTLEFSFDAQGQVATQHDITVTVDNGDAYTLRVENNTGYVHVQP